MKLLVYWDQAMKQSACMFLLDKNDCSRVIELFQIPQKQLRTQVQLSTDPFCIFYFQNSNIT